MGHGVQAHNVRRAESARARAPQFLAREVIDHVVGQPKILDLFQSSQHARHTDAIGNKVRRVVGTNNAFAQPAGDEGFQIVEHRRLRCGRVDQFHQRHVTRRVEEMNTAKTRLDLLGQGLAEFGDRQSGSVGRHDGCRRKEGHNFSVQVELPVHALSDGLDHQVATSELLQMFFVVGLPDQGSVLWNSEWRGLKFFQPFNSLDNDAVLQALLCGQIEQHHGHAHIDEMRGNLRTHDTGAENSDFFNLKTAHRKTLFNYWTRTQAWVRPNGPIDPRICQANTASVSISTLAPARAVSISEAVSGNSLAK